MAYKAFISYSHAADRRLAPSLQYGLERFAKPWYRKRSFRVFRDTTNLSASPELWSSIESALDQSEFLIFLASPQASDSSWVQKELNHWLRHNQPEKLLIVLTAGEIIWNDESCDFDWEQSTSVPGDLKGVFGQQPLFLDFRGMRGKELSLGNETFLNHLATIAAPLLGKSKDDIFGKHIQEHRRTIRLATSALATLLGLLLVAATAGGIAYRQYQVAETRRLAVQEAQDATRLQFGRLLRATAIKARDNEQRLVEAKHQFARAAVAVGQVDPVSTFNSRLGLHFMNRVSLKEILDDEQSIRQLDIVDESGAMLSRSSDGTIRLRDWPSGDLRRRFVHAKVNGATLSSDTHLLLTWSPDGTARVWDTGTGKQIAEVNHPVVSRRFFGTGMQASFLRDGKRILTSSFDGTVRVWRIKDQEQQFVFPHRENEWVWGASEATEHQHLLTWAAIDESGSARVWDLETGELVRKFESENATYNACFAIHDNRVITWSLTGSRTTKVDHYDVGNGELVATETYDDELKGRLARKDNFLLMQGGESAVVWNLDDGEEFRRFAHSGVRRADFGSDPAQVVTWGNDGTARLWRGDGEQPQVFDHVRITGAKLSDDGRRLLTWSSDGNAFLWDVHTGKILDECMHASQVSGARLTNDGRVLTWSRGDGVRIWKFQPLHHRELVHHDEVKHARLYEDEAKIVSWADRVVSVWDANTGESIGRFEHQDWVHRAELMDDGQQVFSCSMDGTARRWDLSGDLVSQVAHRGLLTAVHSADHQLVATGGVDGKVRLWRNDTAELAAEFEYGSWVRGLDLTQDHDKLVAWGEYGRAALLCNVASGDTRQLQHKGNLKGARFTAGGTRAVTWGADGFARIWDVESGREIVAVKHLGNELGRTRNDETQILAWDSEKFRLLDSTTGRPIWQCDNHGSSNVSASLTPSGRYLLTTTSSSRVITGGRTSHLWDVQTGLEVRTVEHDQAIVDAVITDDEQRLLTVGRDGALMIWEVSTGDLLARFDHGDVINGIQLSELENLCLTWGKDRRAKLWDLTGDFDRPTKALRRNLEIATGTELIDATGQLRVLSRDQWLAW